MKKLFFILLISLGIAQTAKADTIDYWHVYYNKIKIRDFTYLSTNDIVLKLDSVKKGDVIVVKYFRDTHCTNCTTRLTVEDEKHHVVATSKGKGGYNPLSFSVNDLVEFKKSTGKDTFEIFYYEGEIKSNTDKTPIFRIKLE